MPLPQSLPGGSASTPLRLNCTPTPSVTFRLLRPSGPLECSLELLKLQFLPFMSAAYSLPFLGFLLEESPISSIFRIQTKRERERDHFIGAQFEGGKAVGWSGLGLSEETPFFYKSWISFIWGNCTLDRGNLCRNQIKNQSWIYTQNDTARQTFHLSFCYPPLLKP